MFKLYVVGVFSERLCDSATKGSAKVKFFLVIIDAVNPDDSKVEVRLLREKINTNLKGVCLKHLAAGKDNELTLTNSNNFLLTF